MRRLISVFILCLLSFGVASAQSITRQYDDVSLSEALLQLSREQSHYTISFIYNELENFRITTSVNSKSLPDAIQQMIGFYPVRMTVNADDGEIFVECTHKTDRHLTGTLTDEQGQPLAYANIALLNPSDSTLLGGGVSNESGYFAVPYETPVGNDREGAVLARFSYIGYKTVCRLFGQSDAGIIRMQPESYTIKGVQVKGHRLLFNTSARGLYVPIQDTFLSQFGSVSDMLSHLPLMMSDGTIVGRHGKPEIYINNKKVRDLQELNRLRADEIQSAEIMTNPGVEYGANVTSVIRLKTVRNTGEGWSGSISVSYLQGKVNNASTIIALNYRTKNGMDFFARGCLTDNQVIIDATANDQLDEILSICDYEKSVQRHEKMKNYYADLGWNWEINDWHSVGLTYTANYISNNSTRKSMDELVTRDGLVKDNVHIMTNTFTKPNMTHTVNVYYAGNIGKWNVDFSADYYGATLRNGMNGGSVGGADGPTYVGSMTNTKSQLLAEKLVVKVPVPKGELTFGEEASAVERKLAFVQSGFSANCLFRQQTTVWSLFANYAVKLDRLSVSAGLRWQNEHNLYDIDGQSHSKLISDYTVLIPRLSVTYQMKQWRHQLSYLCSRYNPPYDYLSSSVNYRSKYEYYTGNPFLKPQATHSISWSINKKWFYAEAYYQYYKDYIRPFHAARDIDYHEFAIVTGFVNKPKLEYGGLSLMMTPQFGIWQLNYSADIAFCKDDMYSVSLTNNWYGPIVNISLDNSFTLPHSWLLNVKGFVSPYNKTENCQTMPTGFLNLRLCRQFLKDKSLSVAILANDILHTQYTERKLFCATNYRIHYREYEDHRRLGIDLSWQFNATKSRYKGSHAGQDERNRLNSSSFKEHIY